MVLCKGFRAVIKRSKSNTDERGCGGAGYRRNDLCRNSSSLKLMLGCDTKKRKGLWGRGLRDEHVVKELSMGGIVPMGNKFPTFNAKPEDKGSGALVCGDVDEILDVGKPNNAGTNILGGKVPKLPLGPKYPINTQPPTTVDKVKDIRTSDTNSSIPQ
ncbi:hypothetical protein KI387_013020, partial [Taxus chinensis]